MHSGMTKHLKVPFAKQEEFTAHYGYGGQRT